MEKNKNIEEIKKLREKLFKLKKIQENMSISFGKFFLYTILISLVMSILSKIIGISNEKLPVIFIGGFFVSAFIVVFLIKRKNKKKKDLLQEEIIKVQVEIFQKSKEL